MQEVVDPLAAAAALGVVMSLSLGKLIVMVRESEVHPSCVNVHFLAQQLASHSRALYVPAYIHHLAQPLVSLSLAMRFEGLKEDNPAGQNTATSEDLRVSDDSSLRKTLSRI